MNQTIMTHKNFDSKRNKIFFFASLILIILLVSLLFLWKNEASVKVLITCGILSTFTVLFSYFYGTWGGIISASACLLGAYTNFKLFFQQNVFSHLAFAVLLSFFVFTSLLVGLLSQKRYRKEFDLVKKSNIDALTKVYNHGYFIQKFEEVILACGLNKENLLFLLIDVDNFKSINDYFGHKIGDEILVAFSDMLTNSVRQQDLVFRYGGDEFVVLMPNTDIDTCKFICNKILKKANKYKHIDIEKFNKDYKLTASIGISCYPDFSHSKSELHHHADVALYESKHSGRNKFTLYNKTINAAIDFNLKKYYEYTKSLLLLVDSKDKYTYGHSLRVSSYASEFGKYLGLNTDEIQQLKVAGLMYDTGKIEWDRDILKNPKPLSATEWDIIKQHPLTSVKIIEKFISDQKILEAVKSHHERYDGLGYPNGIKGNDISLYAMILNIVDSYDALRSQRVYSRSFSSDEVKFEIEKNIGEQFSPFVAMKFIEFLNQLNTNSYEAFNYNRLTEDRFIEKDFKF